MYFRLKKCPESSGGGTVYQRLSAHLNSVDLTQLDLSHNSFKEISRETKSRVETALSSSRSQSQSSQPSHDADKVDAAPADDPF